jgi:hypothetical protein
MAEMKVESILSQDAKTILQQTARAKGDFDNCRPGYEHQVGYVCNRSDHWFALRNINGMWFNLDSLTGGPRQISPSYLCEYIAFLTGQGYMVFLVYGHWPKEVYEQKPSTQVKVKEICSSHFLFR